MEWESNWFTVRLFNTKAFVEKIPQRKQKKKTQQKTKKQKTTRKISCWYSFFFLSFYLFVARGFWLRGFGSILWQRILSIDAIPLNLLSSGSSLEILKHFYATPSRPMSIRSAKKDFNLWPHSIKLWTEAENDDWTDDIRFLLATAAAAVAAAARNQWNQINAYFSSSQENRAEPNTATERMLEERRNLVWWLWYSPFTHLWRTTKKKTQNSNEK